MLKATISSCTTDTAKSMRESGSIIEKLAVEVVKLLTEKDLNYRQALAVLELVQVEIKECKLKY